MNGVFTSSLPYLRVLYNPANAATYRPIALLCSISKVLERVLFNAVFLHILPSISLKQFGLMPGRSCLQQLLTTLLLISNNSKSHTTTDIIYLDFRKTSDSVPHEELLIKLWNVGMFVPLWLLFKDYLTDRYTSLPP